MFLEQRDFLTPDEVARLTAIAKTLTFVEGRVSNPHNVTKVNLQADISDSRHAEASRIVFDAFVRSRPFQDFAMPKTLAPPLISRYEPGMKYGPHADVAFMALLQAGAAGPMRSDVSATVFLSDPGSYEGGELVLHIGTKPVAIKGRAGELFAYPSTLLHEVRPVTAGQRLVAITFIQSLIPDERDRTSLYELKEVLALEGLKMDWVSRVRMSVVLENLVRRWSQTN